MSETTFKDMINNVVREGRLTSKERDAIFEYVDFLVFMRG